MIDTATVYIMGWTLIHSFWQLTILAVLFYIIMIFCKNRKPDLRYYISLLFMFVSVSVTCMTFILMYRRFAMVSSISAFTADVSSVFHTAPTRVPQDGFWTSAIHFIETNVASLTYMYIIGLGLLLMRMGINYWSLTRLKNRSEAISNNKLYFLPGLVEKMNLKLNVEVHTSLKVSTPMVIGALRPVILIPASMLANSTPAIIEAVLAHELAHIKRHDFIINIIQSVIETLFFYHPAVWYFSYMVRREREFCCDQQAVGAGCQRKDLARALSEVGQLQRRQELSMSFGGPSNDLLNRVKYLLGFKPSFHYLPTHSIWYYGSLMGVFLLFSLGKSQFFQTDMVNENQHSSIRQVDTLPKNENRNIEIRKTVQQDHSVRIDTTYEYGQDEMSVVARVPVEKRIEVDTVVKVYQTDSIPKKTKVVTIQADGKVTVIVNDDTVSVYRQPDMKLWRDSVRTVHGGSHREGPQMFWVDSMVDNQRKNLEFQSNFLKLQKEQLDSIQRRLPGMTSEIRSFNFSIPDSLHKFSFTIPPAPGVNLDSLFIRRNFSPHLKGLFSDSTMNLPGDAWAYSLSDTTFSSLALPYSGVYGSSQHVPKSKEMKELDQKIRDKEKELMELRKEQRKKYMEEYKKELKNESK